MNTPSPVLKTASSSLPVGTRLAEFEITGVIGEGGFGIVYSAHDSSLERIVALKEYLPSAFAQRASDGGVTVKSEEHRKTFTAGLSSFINEAKMLAKFSHPGLVEVFRFWEANGTGYMAMRYYRGVTLRETLRSSRQQITEQWLCETLDPILLALKELHNERCFHRDIAPDNILVLPNGKSVLMDFGAARRIISGMTQALTTVLKPGYAPIEQYYDDGSMPQGAWTDIYAIGGLLYHVMTGKVPVQAISRMMSDPLKPVAEIAVGEFSERLSGVVMKCMAVLPENRYQSIEELRAALGWVTTPLVSTVIHKPITKPAPEADFQATMLMTPAAPERQAVVEFAASANKPPPAVPEPVAAASGASIDDLLLAPVDAPRAPVTPVPAKVLEPNKKAAVPGASSTVAAASKPKPKSSSGLWLGLAAVALLLVGVGLFMSGAFNASGPGEPPAPLAGPVASVPAPAPVASAPEVVSAPAVAVAASESVSPSPVPPEPTVVPVVAPVEAAPVASPVALPVASAAKPPADPTTGLVRVELVGGWGTVFVDGQAKGTVPPVLSIRLPAGSHDIEIQNPAVETVKRTVKVTPGKTSVLRHNFAKY
ncbi:MAG: serine/threonine protein kinase [Rhodoferax sp.]|uniref:serine/threonine protein kinase n=1 Tax=Rhodoferax sp. TaxID=50421 RepID=UPI001B405602|nr:serine/threonine-protein kinase [Rhodoferax sp.]MBP9905609.1 serine/threonine protein kinase [Rhodoferax sp.]